VVAGLATGVFALREMRQGDAARNEADASALRGLTSWGAQRGALPTLSDVSRPDVTAGAGAAETGQVSPPVDNSSEIDGAPPVPIEATASASAPMPAWRPLAPEHMPEAPARTRSPAGPQEMAALSNRLESLLVADPEALQQARDLLNEPDPRIQAHNLQILADSFGLE
jgi:hypothetical protein